MLVDDMKSRRVEDGEGADDPKKVLVYNVRTSSWDVIPRHLGVYMLGFPCTPWSMRLWLKKGLQDW